MNKSDDMYDFNTIGMTISEVSYFVETWTSKCNITNTHMSETKHNCHTLYASITFEQGAEIKRQTGVFPAKLS